MRFTKGQINFTADWYANKINLENDRPTAFNKNGLTPSFFRDRYKILGQQPPFLKTCKIPYLSISGHQNYLNFTRHVFNNVFRLHLVKQAEEVLSEFHRYPQFFEFDGPKVTITSGFFSYRPSKILAVSKDYAEQLCDVKINFDSGGEVALFPLGNNESSYFSGSVLGCHGCSFPGGYNLKPLYQEPQAELQEEHSNSLLNKMK